MITLKTLHEATEQEVFNQVAEHLLKQGKASVREGNCFYKLRVSKCAAGCFISDEEYNKNFEGFSWFNLAYRNMVPNFHCALITKLQELHDEFLILCINSWKRNMIELAKEKVLDYKILE